jgi:bifunctional non-homologous end joining protein LigD
VPKKRAQVQSSPQKTASASATLPTYRPQLATLVDAPPDSAAALVELKLDGYRIGATVYAGEVRLESRRNNDWTAQFPTVTAALKRVAAESALLDGEVAAVMPNGITSFQALQNVTSAGARLIYFVFDLLYLDGEHVAALPLEQRKAKLRTLIEKSKAGDTVKYVEHVVGDVARVFSEACKLGAEGVIVKSATAPYRPGRNSGWLKVKCVHRQELVIGGYTDPEGSRAGLGALLVGYYEVKGAFVFAGKVGTGKGFTREFLVGLRKRLDAITEKECPFTPRPKGIKLSATHWVEPKLVVEVQFVEWTSDGHLRHPSLLGLREDKRAADVTRERPRSLR